MICTTSPFTLGIIYIERNTYNENPPYQRESGVWAPDKCELFIDSLLRKFDVPKIYLHDLRAAAGPKDYAIVDGKQRLNAIWDFMDGKFALAPDFALGSDHDDPPTGGQRFADFSEIWKERFRAISIDTTVISEANEEDIEELFSRLNNGEQLVAAEKRNAFGGDMAVLIRTIARDDFFEKTVPFPNRRYAHYEAVVKLLLIEDAIRKGGNRWVDLKKKHLDGLVRENKVLSAPVSERLKEAVETQLRLMRRVFTDQNDVRLAKQAYIPMHYQFVAEINANYGHPHLLTKLGDFINRFSVMRTENLEKSEATRDPTLIEFGRLMQQGTNDKESISERVRILTQYLLVDHSELEVKDKRRAFTTAERYAIWILGEKRCSECDLEINLDQMEADHVVQWAFGGQTTIGNARCLCGPCNQAARERVA
jgi:hypothetical protein